MRLRTTALPMLLAASILSGCAVGPNYVRPVVAAPPQFIGQEAVTARKAAVDTVSVVEWWSGFGDPVLTGLVEEALDSNLDVAQAAARVMQSRAALGGATAALLPSANVQASAEADRSSAQTPVGRVAAGNGLPRNYELYGAGVGASWEIDLFGGLRRGQEAARDRYQASQAGAIAARLAVAAQTADTYVVIRGLQARIAIAEQQIDTERKLVATVDLQYRKGIAAELQLRQAEGALSQVVASLPVLKNGLDVALNALDVLLGDQPGTNRDQLKSVAPIPAAPAISADGGPADLIRRRPDIIVAERELAASNAQIGEAIAEYYPKFSIGGLIGTATTAAGGVFTGASTQAQGLFGLRWRLFDFGRVDAEIKVAKGRNLEALANYRLTVLRASEDVENAFSALLNREAQERALADGEGSLSRARVSSFAAYKGGVVSLIEVLDADNRLLATRDARAQAKTETARAAIASFRALGGGWDPDPVTASATNAPPKG